MTTVAVFADVSNLYFTVRKKWPERRVDFKKLLDELVEDRKLFRCIAYGMELDEKAKSFKNYLRSVGFEPKYQLATYQNEGELLRANWNVGIAVDVFRLVERVDSIIICSTNVELVPLIEWIREKMVRCVVCGCGIGNKLRRSADHCIELTEDLLVAEKSNAGVPGPGE